MTNFTISYKNKNVLIDTILQESNIEELKPLSLMDKLTFRAKNYPDIYCHSGAIDDETLDIVNHAKLVITTSFASKNDIVSQSKIDESLIEVIYPSLNLEYLKPKESKEILSNEFDFDKKRKIIFFTAKNLKSNGAIEFCNIIKSLNYKNVQFIIAGESKQIYNLKFQVSKYNFDEKVLFLEDYENMNLLFSAADIFILPTHISGFSSNILKAMFFKTAVFVSASSSSREVVDTFATMNSPNDATTPFKVDALLGRESDLKLIKKDNKKLSEEFLLERQVERLKQLISNI